MARALALGTRWGACGPWGGQQGSWDVERGASGAESSLQSGTEHLGWVAEAQPPSLLEPG